MVSRVRPLDQLRTTVDFDGEDYGLARTVVAVRVAVVISIGVLLAIGPQWVRQHTAATVAVLAAAMVYAAVVMAYPQLEVRRTRYSWLVTGFDSAFTLALIALSGGVYSPVVSVLALAVIASAARLSFSETLLVAVLLGAAYIPVALTSSPRLPVTAAPALQAGWSALYLIFVAIITAGLSALAEREHRSRLRALVEAEAEHAAAEEERDLRARLLRSYQSQQDGLQVLVHEFRTPVTSLEALTEALTSNAANVAGRPGHQPAAGGPARAPPGRHARRPVRRRAEPPPDILGGPDSPRRRGRPRRRRRRCGRPGAAAVAAERQRRRRRRGGERPGAAPGADQSAGECLPAWPR